ncbi:hypothetical protein PRZ48_003048 [Zasmidium cellare]|uniref:Uncharacterized protein n=1 Tax=Zasmidium cellare TaxID=395010 RepID=A0ABR0EUF4_ZASCE|nr:hypothetical protein PRZ48_003048 [Zasmidium cellare]
MSNSANQQTNLNDQDDHAAEEQFGTLSPLRSRRRRSSELSSPLEGLSDAAQIADAKAYWRKKYNQWAAEGAKGEDEPDLGKLKIEAKTRTFDHSQGETDPFDRYTHGRSPIPHGKPPITKTTFLELTPKRRATTDAETATEDEILDSYFDSNTVPHDTILHHARTNLALATVFYSKLNEHAAEETLLDLRSALSALCPSRHDVDTAMAGAWGQAGGGLEGRLRMRSLVLVAGALGALELVGGEGVGEGEVRGVLGRLMGEVERGGRK